MVYSVFASSAFAAAVSTALVTGLGLPRIQYRDLHPAGRRAMQLIGGIFGLTTAAIPAYLGLGMQHDGSPDVTIVLTLFFCLQATAASMSALILTRMSLKRHTDSQTIETLRREAFLDPLTGLHNRRYVDGRLESALRDRLPSHPLAVMLIDIDDFKLINDQIGHQAGDRVLQSVSMAIASTLRSTDTIGRYGGDEFVAVLPGADGSLGHELAERLRRCVAEIGGGSTTAHPTVSIGLATFPEDGCQLSELVRAADLAMYRAKRDGRNRVAAVVSDAVQKEQEALFGGSGWGADLDHPLDTAPGTIRNT